MSSESPDNESAILETPNSKSEYEQFQKLLRRKLMFEFKEIFDDVPEFDCPPGWQTLIRSVFAKMVEHIKQHPEASTSIRQVKEKYGALRIYVAFNTGDDTIKKILREAERASFKVCDWCGKPGALRHGSWARTLCDDHAEGRWPNQNHFKGDEELYEWTRRF